MLPWWERSWEFRLRNALLPVRNFVQRVFEWYATWSYSLLEVSKKAQLERFGYCKTGARVHKSIKHKVLTNPIYYGDFDWAGKRYRGTDEPIIAKEIFDRGQQIMAEKSGRRTRQQKHHWALSGLLSCGHCGCTLTGGDQEGTLCLYYHCTGHKGKCPGKYVREDEQDRQFGPRAYLLFR